MLGMRDIKVLSILNVSEKNTPYKSLSFEEIGEVYAAKSKTTISESTIRRSLKTLLDNGYIQNGFKRGNVKTYYIVDAGIQLLSEIE